MVNTGRAAADSCQGLADLALWHLSSVALLSAIV